jgi:hypothetical protein
VGIHCADYATSLYPQKLVLTSPTSGGRLTGIVHLADLKLQSLFSLRNTNTWFCRQIVHKPVLSTTAEFKDTTIEANVYNRKQHTVLNHCPCAFCSVVRVALLIALLPEARGRAKLSLLVQGCLWTKRGHVMFWFVRSRPWTRPPR